MHRNDFKNTFIHTKDGGMLAEDLYQAIKARLIEELTVREFAVVDGPLVEGRMHSVSRAFKLIDTTGDANGR